MPLQATSGAASQDAYGGNGVAVVPTYIEDVFSTYLINLLAGTGNQQIPHGLDLSTYGGLTWVKNRASAYGNTLGTTNIGTSKMLFTNTTDAVTSAASFVSFDTNGTTITRGGGYFGNSNEAVVSWNFRKQPKFFDVVTYTGNGTAGRTVSHNLGSVPGCIIVKNTSASGDYWNVYHRSLGATKALFLNDTQAAGTYTNVWNDTAPTSTVFSLGTSGETNRNGNTFVAYLFAHDAGGFGLTGTDNVISCGSFTTNGSGAATVSLGYEPQWVLFKASSRVLNWSIHDTMRGMPVGSVASGLYPNLSGAESNNVTTSPTSTGFTWSGYANETFIYVAIRRGPMKVPTTGTSVFSPNAHIGTEPTRKVITAGFPVDLSIQAYRNLGGAAYFGFTDRLRGGTQYLVPYNTSAEGASASPDNFLFDSNTTLTSGQGAWNNTNANGLSFNLLRRAPSFFDEVCYSGTGSARTVTHNLTVAPEMIITKNRSGPSDNWLVFTQPTGNSGVLVLQNTDALYTPYFDWVPTSTTFSVAAQSFSVNDSGVNYVAYLFATCAGVSKVFSYTGNGSSQTINCGFTGGARFVLIKRTDSTGDWYVWDTARGIIAGNDPHLSLNTTSAEVTTDDTIDTDNTGFVVNQVSATNVNVSSATYIGLAIA